MTVVNLHLGCTFQQAKWTGGKRGLPPKYIVIHSTETLNRVGAAKAVANDFAHRSADKKASTTITVDDTACYRSLTDDYIPYAAPPFNTRGLHIEICGYAKWNRAEWWNHKASIDKAARAAAYWAMAYEVPIRWLSPAGCKAYKAGITSHRNVSQAFGLSNHTDPGIEDNKHFPYDYFMQRVKLVIASV